MSTVLEMKQITKKYGEFTANEQINFTLKKGEVHAIVGENGAGKTTLMRMLYGMEQPTSGEIILHGKKKQFSNPREAIAEGIGMVFQHFMLFPSTTVAENIVIGQEPKRSLWFDRKKAVRTVQQLSEKFKMKVDAKKRIEDCPLGEQQRVEILKVLYHGADIIILDEPSAVLTPIEVKELLVAIRGLAAQGKSIILISHKLHEVLEVADRITVLRQGKVTGELLKEKTNAEEISELMVGRELIGIHRRDNKVGRAILEVQHVNIIDKNNKSILDQIHFDVHAGEIVGIAGVSGNGQTELIQALSGLTNVTEGSITLNGVQIANEKVRTVRSAGLAHIPEDRYMWGSAKEASVKENAMMGHYLKKGFSKTGLLNHKKIDQQVVKWVDQFDIKTTSIHEAAQNLSGGNLQKVIVAREIGHNTPFLIAAEPTRGVDIGAMEFIHQELLNKRNRGEAVLLVSSELTEILTLADRILVMFEGRIVGELNSSEATEQAISILMAGGKR